MKTIELNCDCCNQIFQMPLGTYKYKKKRRPNHKHYCSIKCRGLAKRNGITYKCHTCGMDVYRPQGQIKTGKQYRFCNKSCLAYYVNKIKKNSGRSNLERFLEKRLTENYPNLKIEYNYYWAIKSELDIYIDSLKLGIEINGIFHYKPIFGEKKLTEVERNDLKKLQKCQQENIELYTIDVSHVRHMKEDIAEEFFQTIKNIIDLKLKRLR